MERQEEEEEEEEEEEDDDREAGSKVDSGVRGMGRVSMGAIGKEKSLL